MIRSFAFRSQRVSLHPSPTLQTGQALFAGDSMTLLVGPNGSGKTQALASLASIFSTSPPKGIDVADVDWHATDESAATCGIYYTSTPFEVAVPDSSARFKKIQPKQKRPVRNEAIGKELESEFGLDARRELKLARLPDSDFHKLFYAVISWKDADRKNFLVDDRWVQEFRRRNDDHRQHRYDSTDVRLSDREINDEWDAIRRDFERAIRKHLSPGFVIKFRAYVHAQSRHRETAKSKAQLLARLGFSIAGDAYRVPGPASDTYTQALQTLQAVADILGVDDLTKVAYLINDAQTAKLDEVSLGSLGSVSFTGLSSGAAALIDQFTNIEIESRALAKAASNKHLLLLIDEGDAFLHLRWQQRYVDYLDKTEARLRKRFSSVQVVLATHSPVVMSDFPRECIAILDHRDWTVDVFAERATAIPSISFGAPLDAVIRYVGGAGSLGSFSARIMRELVDDIAAGKPVEHARVDMVDDLVIRRQIQRMLDERRPPSGM